MNGVEILTSTQVVTDTVFNWSTFWITFGVIFAISFIVMMMYAIANGFEWPIMLVIGVAGAIIGSMMGTCGGRLDAIPTAYETQYKVSVSDEVTMTEFYEHYEVIDQDGKIFTVREKTK